MVSEARDLVCVCPCTAVLQRVTQICRRVWTLGYELGVPPPGVVTPAVHSLYCTLRCSSCRDFAIFILNPQHIRASGGAYRFLCLSGGPEGSFPVLNSSFTARFPVIYFVPERCGVREAAVPCSDTGTLIPI